MNDELISTDEFRREVAEYASILKQHGFRRAPEFDSETPTTAAIAYVGRNLAFVFSLDIRDQTIDLTVTRFRNGKLVPTCDGGYSSSLFTHLVKHCGFRGRLKPLTSIPTTASKAKRRISALVNLLEQPCSAKLLADQEDALPS